MIWRKKICMGVNLSFFQCGKMKHLLSRALTKNISSNQFFSKNLLSRNFCQKSVRANFCNFYFAVWYESNTVLFGKLRILMPFESIPWNQIVHTFENRNRGGWFHEKLLIFCKYHIVVIRTYGFQQFVWIVNWFHIEFF